MSPHFMGEFEDILKSYDASKGTIRFALDKSLPAEIVNKIVKARMKENDVIVRKRKLKKQKGGK